MDCLVVLFDHSCPVDHMVGVDVKLGSGELVAK